MLNVKLLDIRQCNHKSNYLVFENTKTWCWNTRTCRWTYWRCCVVEKGVPYLALFDL